MNKPRHEYDLFYPIHVTSSVQKNGTNRQEDRRCLLGCKGCCRIHVGLKSQFVVWTSTATFPYLAVTKPPCLNFAIYISHCSLTRFAPRAPGALPYNVHVHFSTVQHGTVRYSTVQYSTVQYSTVQYSTVQYSTVQYSTRTACWKWTAYCVRNLHSPWVVASRVKGCDGDGRRNSLPPGWFGGARFPILILEEEEDVCACVCVYVCVCAWVRVGVPELGQVYQS